MMNKNRSQENIPVPPADVILSLLHNEPGTDRKFLDFYGGYIHAAATEPYFTEDGTFCGSVLNEDLLQEIQIAIVMSLPVLRRRICEILNGESFFVIITK